MITPLQIYIMCTETCQRIGNTISNTINRSFKHNLLDNVSARMLEDENTLNSSNSHVRE